MIDKQMVDIIESAGIDVVLSLPCNMLSGIMDEINIREIKHVPLCREEEGIGIAAGAVLAGKRPVMLMQNSGLGNALNVLESLNLIYQIPCLLLVSWRGFEGKDAPEHLVMGETMTTLLDTVRIPHRTLAVETITEDLQWIAKTFMEQRIPVALLLKKGIVKTVQP